MQRTSRVSIRERIIDNVRIRNRPLLEQVFDRRSHSACMRTLPINFLAARTITKNFVRVFGVFRHLSGDLVLACSNEGRIADQAAPKKLWRAFYVEMRYDFRELLPSPLAFEKQDIIDAPFFGQAAVKGQDV